MDLQGYQRELAHKHVDRRVQTTTPTIKQALAVGKITKELYLSAWSQWEGITPPSCQSRSCVRNDLRCCGQERGGIC